MTAPARWRRRLGWRGTALLVCGIPWIVYGVSLMTTPRVGLQRAASVITAVMGLHCWGIVWIVCGVIASVTAWLRPGRDAVGFAAAAAPPLVWIGAYLSAAATGQYAQAWAGVPLLVVPVALLVVVAEVTGRRRRTCRCGRGLHGQ